MWRILVIASLPTAGHADSLIATRPIRAQAIITLEDVSLVEADIAGAFTDPAQAIGQEARVMIYPGRALRPSDLGAPTAVTRNQTVRLSFLSGALRIETDGRALDRGGAGDAIKVMNLASHTTVIGIVGADGVVTVGP